MSIDAVSVVRQDLSGVAETEDEKRGIVVLEDGAPWYVSFGSGRDQVDRIAPDEAVSSISARLIQKNREAYETLAR
ncbi:MAG: hypothetical protein IJR14_11235 [Synergistaceae bacterium]|nr:hypothetical protein [Synergistaceae bacterium]